MCLPFGTVLFLTSFNLTTVSVKRQTRHCAQQNISVFLRCLIVGRPWAYLTSVSRGRVWRPSSIRSEHG